MMVLSRSFARLILSAALVACSPAAEDGGTAATGATQPLSDDDSLCDRYCTRLGTTCPAAQEQLKGVDCKEACLRPEDSDTAHRRCLAEAASCADLKACKDTF